MAPFLDHSGRRRGRGGSGADHPRTRYAPLRRRACPRLHLRPPPPAAQPADGPPARRSWLGPVIGGVGVVALGAAGVTRLVANSDYEALKSRCSRGCTDFDAERKSIERMDRAALVAAIGGAVLVGAGVTLF